MGVTVTVRPTGGSGRPPAGRAAVVRPVAEVFPVRPLTVAVLNPYLSHGGRSPWDPAGLAVLAAWGVLGAVVAVRRFAWSPRDL
jgi:ABC-2 type transport system permease protein